MNIEIEKDKIRITLEEIDVGSPEFEDLQAWLNAKIPLAPMYDLPLHLIYHDSVYMEILIPKDGRPTWRYHWTPDEDDAVPAKKQTRGDL